MAVDRGPLAAGALSHVVQPTGTMVNLALSVCNVRALYLGD